MNHLLDLAFGLSLSYGGVVILLIALLMTTAHNKTRTEVAFTVREWLFASLFGVTGMLILMNTGDRAAYTVSVAVMLDVISTVILISLFRAHLRWRKNRPRTPEPTESHPLSMEASHDTPHQG